MEKQSLKFSKEELDSEVWKLITWSNGTYYVSNLGRVRKKYVRSYYILNPYFKSNSRKSSNRRTLYVKIFLDNNGTDESNKRLYKQIEVHKLVAEFFLTPRPSSNHVLYHRNGVITDNREINLKWITKNELGRLTGGRTKKAKGIVKIDPETNEVIDFYKTSREAGRKNFCSYQTVLDSCNGKSKKNCTGFIFRWDGSAVRELSWN